MKILYIAIILFFVLSLSGKAQEIINIYEDDIPNSKKTDIEEVYFQGMYRNVTKPTLETYLPKNTKGEIPAVIICPGGGYSVVVYEGEGISTAKEFAKNGVAAFVLKYRLPDNSTMPDKTIGPLQDIQQAIKIVRENADNWNIDVTKIGIMGFSAGGHVASTAATHYKKAFIKNDNNTSLRPDFQILVYPVISMQDNLTHADSRTKLLGENPSKEVIDYFSNELQTDTSCPAAYLTHAADDNLVDVDNTINYFEKLRKNNVPVEMHIYPKGGHGFIFKHKGWTDPLFQWMHRTGIITNEELK
jgi:acetyl esterase/lipase